jgi:hypothetical protein
MYGFRLRFHAPPGFKLEPTEMELQLAGAPKPLTITQSAAGPNALPTDLETLTIDADGFSSEEEARVFGQSLKRSLAVYSARQRLGFDLGSDSATSALGRAFREQVLNETGIDIRPTTHGLDVFDTSRPSSRLRATGRLSAVRRVANLPTELALDFPCKELPAKVALGVDLFNGVAHDTDSEGRFLSLVSVIEAMAVRRPRHPCQQEFLDSCLASLEDSTLNANAIEALRSGLGNLRTESISSACVKLVREAGGDPKFFRKIYKARSELLHDGVSRTYPELPRQPHLLEDLVQTVLLYQVGRALKSELSDAPLEERGVSMEDFRRRVQMRAYFLWQNRTGSDWSNQDSNWREALRLECDEDNPNG